MQYAQDVSRYLNGKPLTAQDMISCERQNPMRGHLRKKSYTHCAYDAMLKTNSHKVRTKYHVI